MAARRVAATVRNAQCAAAAVRRLVPVGVPIPLRPAVVVDASAIDIDALFVDIAELKRYYGERAGKAARRAVFCTEVAGMWSVHCHSALIGAATRGGTGH